MVKTTPVIAAELARREANKIAFREEWQEFKAAITAAYEREERPRGYAWDQEHDQKWSELVERYGECE